MVANPLILQQMYTTAELNPYLDTHHGIDNHVTYFTYYNTTGNWVTSSSLTETALANDTWKVTLASTAQDTSRSCLIEVAFSQASGGIWNSSCFNPDNDEYVTAIGVRISADSEGKALSFTAGFGNSMSHPLHNLISDSSLLLTDDEAETVYYLPPSFYAAYEANEDTIESESVRFWFTELDADQFLNGEVITIEIAFYSGASMDVFYQWLVWLGLLNFAVAIGMTRAIDLTPNRRNR